MADIKKSWIQHECCKHHCLVGTFWLLAGATLTFLIITAFDNWEEIVETPFATKLYTLTLPMYCWIGGCLLAFTGFSIVAIAVSMNPPRCRRPRTSTRSRASTRHGSRTSSRRRRSSSSRSQERVSQDGNTIQMEHTSAADSDSDINSSKLTHREAQDVVTRLLSQALKPQLATTSDTEPLTKRASSTIKQQPSQSNGSN